MISTLLATVALQTPLTANDIDKAVHGAYRELTDYKESLLLSGLGGDGDTSTVVVDRKISTNKFRLTIKQTGVPVAEYGYDGNMNWAVMYTNRTYMLKEGKNRFFDAKFAPIDVSNIEDGYFHFAIENPYETQFFSKPPMILTLDKFEDLGDKKTRKIVTKTERADKQGSVTLTRWFHADKFILIRFEALFQGKDKPDRLVTGTTFNTSFESKLTIADFTIDSRVLAVFTRKEFP